MTHKTSIPLSDTAKAAFLAGCVAVALVLPDAARTQSLDADRISAVFEDAHFELHTMQFRAELTFFGDGSLRASSAHGTSEGRWLAADHGICVVIEHGDRQGQDCGRVVQRGEVVRVGESLALHPVASALRIPDPAALHKTTTPKRLNKRRLI